MAGDDITVSVVLKDAENNAVTGKGHTLNGSAVTVPNAVAKAGSSWEESAPGTYVRVWTAQTVGEDLTATLKVKDGSTVSNVYSITAGAAAAAGSAIAVDKASYVAGTEMQVTVTLKDSQQNGVSGQTGILTDEAIGVANAEAKAGSSWTEVGDNSGVYNRTYVAKTTGENLAATLNLSDGNKKSGVYRITAGEATTANSAIAVDKASYVAGSEMQVTVTLKDAQGNVANGRATALANAVTVANAEAKPGSGWTETGGTGVYTRTYVAKVAGENLKATLTLAGESQASYLYSITAGAAAAASSAIAVDKEVYTAGTDIRVTVTLQDAQGNMAGGQAASLTDAVSVANAEAKAGSSWAESSSAGIYTRTYVAKIAGEGLTATLKLAGENQLSDTYSIIAGAAAAASSAIAVDKALYTAGTNIQVTVTLKDAQGNMAGGQAAALANAVTVPNAEAKAGSGWTETSSTGIYTRTYVAKTAGENLKATLSLSGGNNASGLYSITAGAATAANSAIAVDKASYVAGTDIQVTVTLKDAQGNLASGQTAALTDAVSVANAEAKAGSGWTESSSAGIYIRTYVAKIAGENLKANLTLAGGNQTSGAYSITADTATAANSAIAVDKATYTAGTDIQVTVTLKDAQGNMAGGQAAALANAVSVPNAEAGSSWTESKEPGIYTRTYIAKTAGENLKATLTLAGANQTSGAYSITAGTATADSSAIAVDKASYVAGTNILVTVTLKDAQGNMAGGQAAALTDTVTVPNAEAKAGSNWKETSSTGIYTRTYLAKTAGENLKATLALAGVSQTSGGYSITADTAAAANSAIAVDKASYVAGTEIQVTVTLKDAQGNMAGSQAAALADAVTVPNAEAKAGGNWTETISTGIYTRTYMAKAAGEKLAATLELMGESKASNIYSITAGAATAANSAIAVDKATYIAGTDIQVKVTLRDAQGNMSGGQSAGLTDDVVSVPNAEAKAGSAWTEGKDPGIYIRTYVAKNAGENLKAALKLAGESKTSNIYSITAGTATTAGSTIAVDKASYVAGTDILVTITLKDAQGNMAGGQAAALSDAVTVPNAEAKADSDWAETGSTGIYTRTYMAKAAGENLKATMTLAGGSQTSGTYSITAGTATAASSAIAVDKASYVAGTDIQVTVMLKDEQDNMAGGQATVLADAVTVPNAETGSGWTETSSTGIYIRTYVAKTAGENLKATLKLTGGSQTSGTYSITAGTATVGGSTIVVDKASYVAGTDIQVTVMLKDAQGNMTGGQAAALADAVTVPNAEAKADSNWTEGKEPGIYTRTYIAKVAAENLRATLKLAGKSQTSGAYSIIAGEAVAASSTITVDKASYVAGTDIRVTVKLKDAQGNIAGGQVTILNDAVTVPNAEAKAGSSWRETRSSGVYEPGVYSRIYVAQTAGENLKAVLTLTGESQTSSVYSISAGNAAAAYSAIVVDKESYIAGTEILVTVTMKDAQGNATSLSGLNLSVPNTEEKVRFTWIEGEEPGVYSCTYVAKVAGENLKATMTLAGESQTSNSYSITAGTATASSSAIAVDKASYVAGTDIQVTVMLKDAQGNMTGGQAAALADAVTVPNAEAKADSGWTESKELGIYTRAYLAKTVGENLKATLKLADGSQTSGVYIITAGTAAAASSTIAVDKASYTAGTDIQVTVTLKDAQGNMAGGQTTALANVVTVPNAEAKADSGWTESKEPGIYTRAYLAKTAGENLKATLKLAEGNQTSGLYSITAGTATAANSAIAVDKASYVAGTDIQVTVTLKDAQGNMTGGQAAALVDAVTVPNAEAKAGSDWAESKEPGIYTRIYVATTVGENLKATLKLADGSQTSGVYIITAGTAAAASSTIAVDKASYTAGTDILVTVALKDAWDNVANGQTAMLTDEAVSVANAEAKSGSNWAEASDKPGVYTRTYVAKVAGENLKATLMLAGASQVSSLYSITAGEATTANSSIAVDKASYVAGTDIQVTITLKDAQGNGATGLAASLTDEAVSVANAEAKAESNWIETSSPGIYSRTYLAKTAGEKLKATLKLVDGVKTSGDYDITVGEPAAVWSEIAVDKEEYTAGEEMLVTVTLKDAQGNAAYGQATALTDAVTVPKTVAKTGSNWTETSDQPGIYSRTYIAYYATNAESAILKLSGESKTSNNYRIKAGEVSTATSYISVEKEITAAGVVMLVKVMLRDAYTNLIAQQEANALLEKVKVSNAQFITGWEQGPLVGHEDLLKKAGIKDDDNTDYSYRALYMAEIAGENLRASLSLPDGEIYSNYSIIAGAPSTSSELPSKFYFSDDGSALKTLYPVESEIHVWVKLRDKYGNPIPGQADLLNDWVTIPNVEAKTGSSWAEDKEPGIYTRTYIAKIVGENLRATLKLSEKKLTFIYIISAGAATAANSTIAVDNTTYKAGADIQVTVTLKDAWGNVVKKKETSLTDKAVSVANAEAKADSNWTEASDNPGVYTRTYVAKVAGENLKATLMLADASQASSPYSITAGEATIANSAIAVDKASYTAGSDIQVTVTLKDAQDNMATGQAAALTDEAVSVANAEAKAGSAWAETSSPGIYARTYLAKTAGENLKAALNLNDGVKTSGTYDITAGAPAADWSEIALDAWYKVGDEMLVTVTLKDAQGNMTGSQAAALTDAVTVPNAEAKAGSSWSEDNNNPGIYTRTYLAGAPGNSLKAYLTLSERKNARQSYDITPGYEVSICGANNSMFSVYITLTNVHGNMLSGLSGYLENVQVDLEAVSGSNWTEVSTGVYLRYYPVPTDIDSMETLTFRMPGYVVTFMNPSHFLSRACKVYN
ncbi:hypothetical protein [Kalamiella sp. sgz302252]|uniref:hypothetical protein n=1 Tax=Pantoea sp. sgz302252 TaxID=3341827 RepID=UPI0036D40713